MKRAWTAGLVVAAAVLGWAAVVSADSIDSVFDIWMRGDNSITSSTGNGYGNGSIFRYESGWWNQWFFNDAQVWNRWKTIDYAITMEVIPPEYGDYLEVAINWTTPAWTDPVTPPIGPADDPFIVRNTIFAGTATELDPVPITLTGDITIPNYNPVWVSIDVRVSPIAMGTDELHVYGTITHECLPEPATLSLLALGSLGALARRRRR